MEHIEEAQVDAWRVKQAESQENVRQLQLQLASARTRLAWFTEAIRKAEWKAIGVTENVKLEQPIKTPADSQVLTDLPDEASLASLARQTRGRKKVVVVIPGKCIACANELRTGNAQVAHDLADADCRLVTKRAKNSDKPGGKKKSGGDKEKGGQTGCKKHSEGGSDSGGVDTQVSEASNE